MEIETPVQPVASRRGWSEPAVLALIGVLGALGLLVWQPWGLPASGTLPTMTPTAASQGALGQAGTAVAPQAATPLSAALIAQEWSVVAVEATLDPAEPAPRITQQKTSVLSRSLAVGTAPTWVCRLSGEYRRPLAARLPVGTERLLGVAFPAAAGAWGVSVAALDGSMLALREEYLRDIPPRMTPPLTPWVHVFALADGTSWPAGIYRFEVAFPDGSTRYLYACLGIA